MHRILKKVYSFILRITITHVRYSYIILLIENYRYYYQVIEREWDTIRESCIGKECGKLYIIITSWHTTVAKKKIPMYKTFAVAVHVVKRKKIAVVNHLQMVMNNEKTNSVIKRILLECKDILRFVQLVADALF